MPINPALLAVREEGFRAAGTKRWDRWLATGSASLGTLMLWLIGGLDARFGWTAEVALAVHFAGVAISILGYVIFLWAMAANAFFAKGVRILKAIAGIPWRPVAPMAWCGILAT